MAGLHRLAPPVQRITAGANAFNSGGLIVIIISGELLWQAAKRLLHPVSVQGLVPIIAGLAAALASYGVAYLLREPSKGNASTRLAYVHNLGDGWVSSLRSWRGC